MKRKYQIRAGDKTIEREYSYIPVRYIVAVLITIMEIAAIIGIMIVLCIYIPYFYILCYVTAFGCIIKIIASDDNPDYKVPWILFVLVVPVAGFMLYFLFYSRKLQKKYIRRLDELRRYQYKKNDAAIKNKLAAENPMAASHANMLTEISGSRLLSIPSKHISHLARICLSACLWTLQMPRTLFLWSTLSSRKESFGIPSWRF